MVLNLAKKADQADLKMASLPVLTNIHCAPQLSSLVRMTASKPLATVVF